MYASLSSLGLIGIEPYLVQIEVDSRRGLPGFDIVGLPDLSVKESRDRVRSALQNMGYPALNSKVVANLAPADMKKQGSVYDLPVLLALLCACGYENFDFTGTAVIGEVGLSGEVRGVTGVLPMVLDAKKLGLSRVIIPLPNAAEVSAIADIEVLAASHVREVIDYFKNSSPLISPSQVDSRAGGGIFPLDFADVKGQDEAKLAMQVAAAGGHNILLIGPPGTGKSMLAKRLPSILPAMTREESVETTKIYSVAGLLLQGQSLITERPFRAPHHTASGVALTGGGSNPKPGDLSLAHNGILFLDELPEFSKDSLEALRQPLEDGQVSISRVKQRLTYPARVMLVAAMNPCPCGHYGSAAKACVCSRQAIQKYLGRVSGPLLDRMDIHIEVPHVPYEQLSADKKGSGSAGMRERVAAARLIQQKRYEGLGIACNAQLTPAQLDEACGLESSAAALLKAAYERLGLSARGYDRILKVARTIADLDGAGMIAGAHVSQAIQLRSLDRKYWG